MILRIVRADPAGNITLFVLDPVEKAERPALAARLMEIPALAAEQVGFVLPPRRGGDGRFEMMGGEFCGNATRAFGLLLARERGVRGNARFQIETSGTDGPVVVAVDTDAGAASAEMPLPRFVRGIEAAGMRGTLVHLGGIAHLVVDAPPDADFFAAAEPLFTRECPGLDAYGVMFLHAGRLTPWVRVAATGTLVREGSCGSGTLAAALAESMGAPDGVFGRDYVQPAGTIRAEVEKRDGAVAAARIGGAAALDEPAEIEL